MAFFPLSLSTEPDENIVFFPLRLSQNFSLCHLGHLHCQPSLLLVHGALQHMQSCPHEPGSRAECYLPRRSLVGDTGAVTKGKKKKEKKKTLAVHPTLFFRLWEVSELNFPSAVDLTERFKASKRYFLVQMQKKTHKNNNSHGIFAQKW